MRAWKIYALIALLAVALSSLSAWVIWLAWNEVAVTVFGAPRLTFGQVWLVFTALGFLGKCVRSFSPSNKQEDEPFGH